MLRLGKKIKLTDSEKDSLSTFSREQVNPDTVADYNAWWDHVKQTTKAQTPEERLLVAMADHMKVTGQ